jgi:hypothetical protein
MPAKPSRPELPFGRAPVALLLRDSASVLEPACASIICGPRPRAAGDAKTSGLMFEMGSVVNGSAPSRKAYSPCHAQSWVGFQLEWCGPFATLDECVVACQAYYEMGGREGAEKVAMRRDLLDLLL